MLMVIGGFERIHRVNVTHFIVVRRAKIPSFPPDQNIDKSLTRLESFDHRRCHKHIARRQNLHSGCPRGKKVDRTIAAIEDHL